MPSSGGAVLTPGGIVPGTNVDHFRVIKPIGRGGMADVYLAYDTRLGRQVALKAIRADLHSEAVVKRLRLEARAMARLSHPNIVAIYFVGSYQGTPYLVLEYLEGVTLRQHLRGGGLEVGEVLRIGQAVAEAVAEAHRHQVLHRDLKPENILIPRDGRVRVLDFGLAKLVEARERLYRLSVSADTGPPIADRAGVGEEELARHSTMILALTNEAELCGTPYYMSPEQWRGTACGPATDVWGLGVILYELLEGHGPFSHGTRGELYENVVGEVIAPPIEARDIPAELASLVARCLAKDPSERPTAAEAATALREISRQIEARSSAPTVVHAVKRPVARRTVVVAGALGFAALAAGLSFAFLRRADLPPSGESSATPRGAAGTPARAPTTRTRQDARPTTTVRIELVVLPGGIRPRVYLDGALHEENPLIAPFARREALLRIEADGYEPVVVAITTDTDQMVRAELGEAGLDASTTARAPGTRPGRSLVRRRPRSSEPDARSTQPGKPKVRYEDL